MSWRSCRTSRKYANSRNETSKARLTRRAHAKVGPRAGNAGNWNKSRSAATDRILVAERRFRGITDMAGAAAGRTRTRMPSRPGEFHPESLTDPDVILSHHPARVIAPRLPPLAEPSGSSRFDPVGPCSTAMTCPLCSTGITPLHNYYEAVRPSPAHRYFGPRGWSRLRLFP